MIYYIDGQLFKLFLCCFMLNHKITPCYFLTLQLAQSFPSLIYVQDSQLLSRFSFAVCTCIILMYLYCCVRFPFNISVYIKQEEFLKKIASQQGTATMFRNYIYFPYAHVIMRSILTLLSQTHQNIDSFLKLPHYVSTVTVKIPA